MSDIYWIGGTTAVAQENRFTPGGTIEAGDKFIITLTGEDGTTQTISATATSTTVAQTCADLLTAWNASTASLKSGITASNQTTYFKLLGTAGVPFYAAASTTESDDSPADDQTFSKTATTACAGPSDWNTAANWSTAAVPANGDEVTFDGRATTDVTYGLNQSAVTLANLYINKALAYKIGQSIYPLRIGATSWVCGTPNLSGSSTSGSPRVNLDFGTTQFTGVVIDTGGTSADTGLEPFRFKGTNASNVLGIKGGVVGIGTNKVGDAASIPTINIDGGTVNVAAGVTWTTITNNGGTVNTYGGGTTLTNISGTTNTRGGTAITTLNAYGGTINAGHRNSGGDSSTNLNIYGGTVDFSVDPRPATIDTRTWQSGTITQFSASQMTYTNLADAFGNFTKFTLTAS